MIDLLDIRFLTSACYKPVTEIALPRSIIIFLLAFCEFLGHFLDICELPTILPYVCVCIYLRLYTLDMDFNNRVFSMKSRFSRNRARPPCRGTTAVLVRCGRVVLHSMLLQEQLKLRTHELSSNVVMCSDMQLVTAGEQLLHDVDGLTGGDLLHLLDF